MSEPHDQNAFRDPRFDPRCSGSNDFRHFVRNYAFLDQVRQDELAQLERAFKKEKDPEKRNKIKETIRRLKNKLVENNNKSKKLELISQLKAEKSDPTPTSSKGRKRPKNIKKSDIKKSLLVQKFKELKESGRLSKYLERKRKKLINQDKKSLMGPL